MTGAYSIHVVLRVGVTIGLEETSFTVDEGELVEVCVILISGTLEREVTVTLQTSSGTASVGGS